MGPRGQEPNESTDDAVWLDLVARLEEKPTDSSAMTIEPPARTEDPAARGSGPTDRERVDAIFRDQPRRPDGPRDYSEPVEHDDDEGFVPAEPPPLGTGDPLTVLAWIGAAGGPMLLLLFAMFWRDAPLAATLGVLAIFVCGAGYLVTKLPKNREIGDDGAEV